MHKTLIYSKALKCDGACGVAQPQVVLMSPLVTVKQGRIKKEISTKSSLDRQGNRWKVVHVWQRRVSKGLSSDENPEWRQIARECNTTHAFVKRWVTRYKETGSVKDEGVGRKPGHGLILGASGLKRAHQCISEPLGTKDKTANRLAQEGFPRVSATTISRVVRTTSFPGTKMDEPLVYKPPRRTTNLTAPQKEASIK